ncbi:MAG TPA: NAD(+) synthase [Planctomycetota bacterium]
MGPEALALDPAAEVERVCESLREIVLRRFRRRGAVLGLSGGVDSSVCAALCARAFGPDRVLALFMPERDSSGDSLRLGRAVAEAFRIPSLLEDLEPSLRALGCYERQIEAIRRVVPEYGDGWKCKLVLPSVVERERLNVTLLSVQDPSGEARTLRLTSEAYLQLVAATNYKQRARKMTEYYHADRLNYVVCGTPNRLEYDLGFFVKQGDGAADVKPIAHLYKTQVYQLAEHLGVPDEILRRPPTTDTFSMPQTQDEFYFALPYDRMDLCLYAYDRGLSSAEAAPAARLSPAQMDRVYRDITAKRRAAAYLHAPPAVV